MKLFLSLIVMIVMILPTLAHEKDNIIVIYEGLHIPIKFVNKVHLDNHTAGDEVDIEVNEDTGVDGKKVFKKGTRGKAVLSVKNSEWDISSGTLKDANGIAFPVDIKGFHLKDFLEDDEYIIPEGYVIDAFTKEKYFK